jgi:hypothetical protein
MFLNFFSETIEKKDGRSYTLKMTEGKVLCYVSVRLIREREIPYSIVSSYIYSVFKVFAYL